ncbi:MAG TPA: hypothetical protein VGM14_00085 [Streptosporangiaceae bacterium]
MVSLVTSLLVRGQRLPELIPKLGKAHAVSGQVEKQGFEWPFCVIGVPGAEECDCVEFVFVVEIQKAVGDHLEQVVYPERWLGGGFDLHEQPGGDQVAVSPVDEQGAGEGRAEGPWPAPVANGTGAGFVTGTRQLQPDEYADSSSKTQMNTHIHPKREDDHGGGLWRVLPPGLM